MPATNTGCDDDLYQALIAERYGRPFHKLLQEQTRHPLPELLKERYRRPATPPPSRRNHPLTPDPKADEHRAALEEAIAPRPSRTAE